MQRFGRVAARSYSTTTHWPLFSMSMNFSSRNSMWLMQDLWGSLFIALSMLSLVHGVVLRIIGAHLCLYWWRSL